MLLDAASDDLVDPDQIRRLLKDLREVRMAKMRSGVDVLDDAAIGGGGVALTGVGAMELGEERGFLAGVVDGLRYVILLISSRKILLTFVAKLAPPKNKLAANSWPNKEPMAVMMELRTKRKKITWSSKMHGIWVCFFWIGVQVHFATRINATRETIFMYIEPIYPILT
jgi:hypothetical protein